MTFASVKTFKFLLPALLLAAGFIWLAARPAQAAKGKVSAVSVAVVKDPDAVVAELFTSQGCSSCPAADAFLSELAHRADVITLEMHVDYWDDLKTFFAGKWKDPFSSPTWSQRQQNYNRVIMNSDRVFTPQIVIDGRLQDVGTRRQSVFGEIEQAKSLRRQHFKITPELKDDGEAVVTVEGPGLHTPANVLLLRVTRQAVTRVTGGENHGATLKNRNIATDMLTIGTYPGGKQSYKIKMAKPAGDDTCAVLLQDPDNMHILSARFCDQ
ncbi:MAG: DUF1223 domain-containing protein [Alphaproteobacteria bacterium]|nr:DUF1223 domain-containing protein [Alphaproteobacteria bacterium]